MTVVIRQDEQYDKMIFLFTQGDRDGLAQLYDQYAPALLGIITQILEDPELSCDCLQHSFNEIWKQKASYDNKRERIFTWMMKIARRSARNFLKNGHDYFATGDRPMVGRHVCVEPGNDPAKADQADSSSSLTGAEPDEVLQLVYIKGFTLAETARRLNMSVETVKLKLVFAIKNLKK